MRTHLKAPPWNLVLRWGKELHMSPLDIKQLSDRLKLRHALGSKKIV